MPGIDLETVLLLSGAFMGVIGGAVATVVGVQHLRGWVPRRYRDMLRDIQRTTADAITTALTTKFDEMMADGEESLPDPEEALRPLSVRLEALPGAIGAELTKALNAYQEQAMKELAEQVPEVLKHPPVPEGVRAMGTDAARDKALTESLKSAVGQDAIGPYGAILEQFAPTVYGWLQEHPSEVMWALEQPWLQSLIKKAATLAGGLTGGQQASGWGT